ncbi:MAG: DUF3078 domain-containing protein [Ignavibacteriae bacterium]|nr:DUF3078 domain-containing protein [Ignavibacteriota bacterium]
MMKKTCKIITNIFIIVCITFSEILSQTNDTTNYKWVPSLVGGLNFSQIAFSNWTKGGENSLTWTLNVDFNLNFENENLGFKTKFRSLYGRTKFDGNDYRTNENEIYLDQILSYHVDWKVDPFFSNSFRTQLTTGYDHSAPKPVKVSDFFDPAIITQSVGFTYDKLTALQTRLGIALQHTTTDIYRKYTNDVETLNKEESYKFETGFESVTNAKINLDDNIIAESNLILFTRFEEIDVWDVRWDNKMVAKVNSWLNVSFTYNFIFKKSESIIAQMKESWQMGISYNFI